MAFDGLPVAAGDRACQFESVLDRPLQQRHERLGRRPGGLEEPRGDAIQRDEEVRSDRSAGVIERSVLVGEQERAQVEGLREPGCPRAGLVVLTGQRRPGSVELFGAARADERLERMNRETADVGVERGEWRAARDVGDPRAGLDRTRDAGDRAVGNAKKPQLGVFAHHDTSLAESRGDRRAGASGADDGDGIEHGVLQFLTDTGHP